MSKIKELTIFTSGDSGKISTWSNIPYFFTQTLLSKGIKINRVNISPSIFFSKFFNLTIYLVIKKINKNSTYNYFRSLINFLNVRFRISRALKKYSNSDAYVFLTFSHSSIGLTNKPTVLFSDWPYEHYLNYFLEREPDCFEKMSIKRENNQIEKSTLCISLFPGVTNYMRTKFKNPNIFYLGNVVNTVYNVSENEIREIIEAKLNSKDLLFIGSKAYQNGAEALISAFRVLKEKYMDLKLHIVGMNYENFDSLPVDVYCHGYLNKADADSCYKYYKLLREARIYINTNPKWSAFSATIESMYFFTPVITTPYNEFIKTFGEQIDFGYYCEQNSPALIKDKIAMILDHNDYSSLCKNARSSVNGFTWGMFIDKLLKILDDFIN